MSRLWGALRIGAILAMWGLFGCKMPLGTNLERIEPWPHWPGLYLEVVECVGETGPMGYQGIRWYVADAPILGSKTATGAWRGDEIVIRRDMLNSDVTVKHELIHYVMQDAVHYKALFNLCTIIT